MNQQINKSSSTVIDCLLQQLRPQMGVVVHNRSTERLNEPNLKVQALPVLNSVSQWVEAAREPPRIEKFILGLAGWVVPRETSELNSSRGSIALVA